MASSDSCWEPQLLLVYWIDAHTSDSAWTTLDAFEVEQAQVQSVGWLVQETPSSISICMSRAVGDDERDLTTVLTIPKPWISRQIQLSD